MKAAPASAASRAAFTSKGVDALPRTYALFIGGFYISLSALWLIMIAVAVAFLGRAASGWSRHSANPWSSRSPPPAVKPPKLIEGLTKFGIEKSAPPDSATLGHLFNVDGSMMTRPSCWSSSSTPTASTWTSASNIRDYRNAAQQQGHGRRAAGHSSSSPPWSPPSASPLLESGKILLVIHQLLDTGGLPPTSWEMPSPPPSSAGTTTSPRPSSRCRPPAPPTTAKSLRTAGNPQLVSGH